MLTLNVDEVRAALWAVARAAFPGARWPRFELQIIPEENSKRHGDWSVGHGPFARIRVYNLSRAFPRIVKTGCHELAHHGDHARRGTTGHDREFYAVYKRLLEAAHEQGVIDLGRINDEIEERDLKALETACGPLVWTPVAAKRGFVVRVGRGYEARFVLARLGFTLSKVEGCWVAVADDEGAAQSLRDLAVSAGALEVRVLPAADYEVVPRYFVIVDAASVGARGCELRELGFTVRPGVGWFCRMPAMDAVARAHELSGRGFSVHTAGRLAEGAVGGGAGAGEPRRGFPRPSGRRR